MLHSFGFITIFVQSDHSYFVFEQKETFPWALIELDAPSLWWRTCDTRTKRHCQCVSDNLRLNITYKYRRCAPTIAHIYCNNFTAGELEFQLYLECSVNFHGTSLRIKCAPTPNLLSMGPRKLPTYVIP